VNLGTEREQAEEQPFRDRRSYTPDRLAERMLAAGRAVEGERKLVTVLFADVVGSMELAERLGAEDWRRVMDRCCAIICEAVHRFEGMVDKFTGDGVMALFGAPLAQEDHAARACHAALRLLEHLSGYSAELARRRGLEFAVRIGLNSGEVVTGSIGDDLTLQYTAIGNTVGLANRVQSLATPNAAFLSVHTAALVEGYFELRDRGDREIEGLREPVRIYELGGLGPLRTHLEISRARGLSRFVGRESEKALLQAALDAAIHGSGRVVGVVGDAGIGKSRLCYEFTESCRRDGIRVLAAQCTARGARQPRHLLRALVGRLFGITDWDTERAAREKVAGSPLLLGPSSDREVDPILEVLGIHAESASGSWANGGARRRLFEILEQLLLGAPGARPTVILIEELRWIDPVSEEFVNALVDALPSTRTLLLAAFRPEYDAPWLRRPQYQRLSLVPLDDGAIDALLRDQLGSDPSLAELSRHIREHLGGNPFFIEELIRHLIETGSLEGERGGLRVVGRIDETAVPASVEALLEARIDRLGERDKLALEAAAVIGDPFTEPVLERVTGLSDTELCAALRTLTTAELIVADSSKAAGGLAFKHHLIHEVALRSQLDERRTRTHLAVARALEQLYPERLDELAGPIAGHLEAAGESALAARWSARAAAAAGTSELR
jgi:class 3 adenylate cyclase